MAETTFTVLYWNIYGGYTLEDKDWGSRVDAQAKLITAADADVIILLECHEERDIYLELTDKLPEKYKVSTGKGGNQLVYNSERFEIITKSSRDIKAGLRWVTKWNLLEPATTKRFWVIGAHAPAGDTAARKRARAAYYVGVLNFCKGIARGIMGIDRNSSTESTKSKAYGRSVLNLAGWKELKIKSIRKSPDSDKASHNSHSHTEPVLVKGEPIESIHTARLIDVREWSMIPTGSLSDHNALKARVSVR